MSTGSVVPSGEITLRVRETRSHSALTVAWMSTIPASGQFSTSLNALRTVETCSRDNASTCSPSSCRPAAMPDLPRSRMLPDVSCCQASQTASALLSQNELDATVSAHATRAKLAPDLILAACVRLAQRAV